LVNLLLAIAGVLLVLILLIVLIASRKKEDEQKGEVKKHSTRHWVFWAVSLVAGITAIVLFLLTENMTLPMIMTDGYTLWQVIIFVVLAAFFVLGLVKGKKTTEQQAYQNVQ